MIVVYVLLVFAILNIVYQFVFFASNLVLGTTEKHYHFGFAGTLFSFQVKGTRFSFGLYVPIIGLARIYSVNELGEKNRRMLPWEFHDRSLWRRWLGTLSGAVGLFAFVIVANIVWTYKSSEQIVTKEEINRHGIRPSALGEELGLRRGDKIVDLNGKAFNDYSELIGTAILKEGAFYTIERDGKQLRIDLADVLEMYTRSQEPLFRIDAPFEIGSIGPGTPAEKIGLRAGDRIVSVNNESVYKLADVNNALGSDEDGLVVIDVLVNGNPAMLKTHEVQLDADRRLGFYAKELVNYTVYQRGLIESVTAGFTKSLRQLKAYTQTLAMIFGYQKPKALGGPIGISNVYNGTSIHPFLLGYGTVYFIWNFLPLPLAAFWEFIALGYQSITRKKYPVNVFRGTLTGAWVLYIGLVALVLVTDIAKLL